MSTYTRRDVLRLTATTTSATLFGTAMVRAASIEERDPVDRVPRRFSVQRFLSLSADEIHMANLAVRRNRRILIEGYSASESKEIIQLAAKDPAAARARLTK